MLLFCQDQCVPINLAFQTSQVLKLSVFDELLF
jgi:hypothetical protein